MALPDDPTPEIGAPTDLARLGTGSPKPAHERTASEDGDAPWDAIAAAPEFKELVRAKLRFIIPATAFFFLYFVALLILVGFFPELMKKRVFGAVNLAYAFGLSQFFMAWIMAAIYVKVAAGWDRRSDALLAKMERR